MYVSLYFKRILQAIPLLLLISFIVFSLIQLAPLMSLIQ
jgi:ABC-type dipeptide/oligopeptide/nickel transport system permease component